MTRGDEGKSKNPNGLRAHVMGLSACCVYSFINSLMRVLRANKTIDVVCFLS